MQALSIIGTNQTKFQKNRNKCFLHQNLLNF